MNVMNATSPLSPPNPGPPAGPSLREAIASAGRYWERRRIAYNIVLTALVLGWVVFTWPHFRPAVTLPYVFLALAYMLFLAVLGNVCYCAAYPVDLVLQQYATPEYLRRGRRVLWWAGMIFAFALAYYWIGDEIYAS
jgi:hypothetical protein